MEIFVLIASLEKVYSLTIWVINSFHLKTHELPKNPNLKNHLLAISASLLIGVGLMAVKFFAFWLTDSAAILSDALESIINVVAAGFALGSIIIAAKSPDPTHPYGHGKVEYFSAGFEGALIILAALGIFYEAWPRLLHPQAIPRLEKGLLLILGAALVNLILGLVLVMRGPPHQIHRPHRRRQARPHRRLSPPSGSSWAWWAFILPAGTGWTAPWPSWWA